jgi:hypothetical protein
MDSEAIRALIRQKLEDGRLPHDGAAKVHGRPSTREECDACETVLSLEQLLIEATTQRRQHHQFHVGCYQMWDSERRHLSIPAGLP